MQICSGGRWFCWALRCLALIKRNVLSFFFFFTLSFFLYKKKTTAFCRLILTLTMGSRVVVRIWVYTQTYMMKQALAAELPVSLAVFSTLIPLKVPYHTNLLRSTTLSALFSSLFFFFTIFVLFVVHQLQLTICSLIFIISITFSIFNNVNVIFIISTTFSIFNYVNVVFSSTKCLVINNFGTKPIFFPKLKILNEIGTL